MRKGNIFDNRAKPITPTDSLSRFVPSLTDKDLIKDLSDVEKVAKIGLKSILQDRRVNDAIYHKARNIVKRNAAKLVYRSGFAFGILTALVHTAVMEQLSRSPRSPLRSLTAKQINTLITAWTIQQIGPKVFTADNIIKWTKSGKIETHAELLFLKDSGLIQPMDAAQIHRATGKIVTPRRGAPLIHYSISRTGEKLLLQYFALYEEVHERLTGAIWTEHLEMLGPEMPDLKQILP